MTITQASHQQANVSERGRGAYRILGTLNMVAGFKSD
jgi:hypothetical protein